MYSLSNGDSPAPILFFKHVGAGHQGTVSNENVDALDVRNGNWKLIFSLFQCSHSANSYSGINKKAFRFTVWDRRVPSSETLLFMTSGTSVFSLLKLAVRWRRLRKRHLKSEFALLQLLFHRFLENVNKRRLNFLSLFTLEYGSQEFVGLKRVRFHLT